MFVAALLVLALSSSAFARFGASSVQSGSDVTLFGGAVRAPDAEAADAQAGSLSFSLETQQWRSGQGAGEAVAHGTVVEWAGAWFSFGGSDGAVVRRDARSGATAELATSGAAPTARVAHSASVSDGTMYVLGGERSADGVRDGGFFALDLASGVWRELPSPLGALAEHSATIADGLLWVYGGRDASGAARSALWTYDLTSGEWREAEAPRRGPGARFGHAACVAGDELLVFGGVDRDGAYRRDVWALRLHAGERDAPAWQRAAVVDEASAAPSARAHASCAVHDHALWIFGGADAAHTALDVWALDLEFLQWEQIACFPGVTFPQCRAAAVRVSDAAEPLSRFAYVSAGVSAAEYSVSLHSAPAAPVHVTPRVDAAHVQLTPSELVFDESNWNVPQRVRVLALEGLYLPGDAVELQVAHETRSADAAYARAPLAKRAVHLPSRCGDGRCMGHESAASCAADCRNADAPFCGDGLCLDETHASCAADCSVQGSDNSCPADAPVRCVSGACVADAHMCGARAASTAATCDADAPCRSARLACAAADAHLCPDGSCAAAGASCAPLAPCAAGERRCFDTSCAADCAAADGRCPPAARNLDLGGALCRADPPRGSVQPIEAVERAGATLATVHRPAESAARVNLLAADGAAYYGQLAFPGGALDGRGAATLCPCGDEPAAAGDADPFVGVRVTPLDDAALPAGGFGGFELAIDGADAAPVMAPHRASVWIAHERVLDGRYCLARFDDAALCARTGEHGAWRCVDEQLETSSADAACACELKHTRGHFGVAGGRGSEHRRRRTVRVAVAQLERRLDALNVRAVGRLETAGAKVARVAAAVAVGVGLVGVGHRGAVVARVADAVAVGVGLVRVVHAVAVVRHKRKAAARHAKVAARVLELARARRVGRRRLELLVDAAPRAVLARARAQRRVVKARQTVAAVEHALVRNPHRRAVRRHHRRRVGAVDRQLKAAKAAGRQRGVVERRHAHADKRIGVARRRRLVAARTERRGAAAVERAARKRQLAIVGRAVGREQVDARRRLGRPVHGGERCAGALDRLDRLHAAARRVGAAQRAAEVEVARRRRTAAVGRRAVGRAARVKAASLAGRARRQRRARGAGRRARAVRAEVRVGGGAREARRAARRVGVARGGRRRGARTAHVRVGHARAAHAAHRRVGRTRVVRALHRAVGGARRVRLVETEAVAAERRVGVAAVGGARRGALVAHAAAVAAARRQVNGALGERRARVRGVGRARLVRHLQLDGVAGQVEALERQHAHALRHVPVALVKDQLARRQLHVCGVDARRHVHGCRRRRVQRDAVLGGRDAGAHVRKAAERLGGVRHAHGGGAALRKRDARKARDLLPLQKLEVERPHVERRVRRVGAAKDPQRVVVHGARRVRTRRRRRARLVDDGGALPRRRVALAGVQTQRPHVAAVGAVAVDAAKDEQLVAGDARRVAKACARSAARRLGLAPLAARQIVRPQRAARRTRRVAAAVHPQQAVGNRRRVLCERTERRRQLAPHAARQIERKEAAVAHAVGAALAAQHVHRAVAHRRTVRHTSRRRRATRRQLGRRARARIAAHNSAVRAAKGKPRASPLDNSAVCNSLASTLARAPLLRFEAKAQRAGLCIGRLGVGRTHRAAKQRHVRARLHARCSKARECTRRKSKHQQRSNKHDC
eukprot:TRINITY_DN3349_c0_g1_i3.p1 TRINITY_DN3349_c0_g1~~TRINITY_DN3349_c0_g1_i3.p1  ORF type:complete len:1687 (-),score=1165.13 TRINITY_DN3349_c0_g1_i3:41-5053(-)